MRFLNKIFILLLLAGLGCVAISYYTGDSSFLSIGGMISVIVGIFGAYIVYKLLWSVMGIYLNFALISVACVFCVYLSGKNVLNSDEATHVADIEEMVNQTNTNNDGHFLAQKAIDEAGRRPVISESPVDNAQNTAGQPVTAPVLMQPIAENNSNFGFLEQLKSIFNPPQEEHQITREMYNNINPSDYPSVKGYPRVVRGSILQMNGYRFRLYGIEAPYPDQTCADNRGRSYACGKKAIVWLQNWLNNREVTCYVLGNVVNGYATAICTIENDKYDIATAVMRAGWAVAYTKNTDKYIPYEREAAKAHRGLWRGTFYKPWDWYKMQTRKVDIKIKNANSNNDFDFWGLF